MDGIHKEENAPASGVGSINMHDPPNAGLSRGCRLSGGFSPNIAIVLIDSECVY